MTDEFATLTHDQLTHASGGFLPLLGLIGAGASLAGQITGAIGQSKAKKAEQIMADAQAGQGGSPASGAGTAAPAGPGNVMAQPPASGGG